MRLRDRIPTIAAIALGMVLPLGGVADAATAVWFDGYQATAGTDINADLGSPRQGGSPIPLDYSANVDLLAANQTVDYHQQIIGDPNAVALMQLAGDSQIFSIGTAGQNFHAYASPNHSFTDIVGNEVYGRRITVEMDAFSNLRSSEFWDPNANGGQGGFDPATNDGQFDNGFFTQAAITIGSSHQLGDADSNNKLSGISVIFIEQTFDDALANDPDVSPYFIQIRNAGDGPFDPSVNLFKNPAGEGPGFVDIRVTDPGDGNPWDGVGVSVVGIFVDGVHVYTHTQGGGGYTDNYITLDGANQKNVKHNALATHTFDNLTVYSAAIPEPTTAVLLGFGMCGLAIRRRRAC